MIQSDCARCDELEEALKSAQESAAYWMEKYNRLAERFTDVNQHIERAIHDAHGLVGTLTQARDER